MSNKQMKKTNIESELYVRASAELEKQVKEELERPDPDDLTVGQLLASGDIVGASKQCR